MGLTFDHAFDYFKATPLHEFERALAKALQTHFFERTHGRTEEWDTALAALPDTTTDDTDFTDDVVRIGTAEALPADKARFSAQLRAFNPWRKGPWDILGTYIDTEWRSDLKWARIAPHLASLRDRHILDIGSGNGYYMCRMLGEGASFVLGADPTLIFLYQFEIVRRFVPNLPAFILPLRGEHLPRFGCFDTVFSMGVLYHRKSPLSHLHELKSFIRPGGELVMETLVIEDDTTGDVLEPQGRYAKMGNVWAIPSVPTLERWIADADFENIRTVDVTVTTANEQRATEWMTFQSLPDFLDSKDPSKTVEGYPAPTRAVVIATKP